MDSKRTCAFVKIKADRKVPQGEKSRESQLISLYAGHYQVVRVQEVA
jgi:hypothetical protein